MRFFKKKRKQHIDLDEIFIDSSNLPSFDRARLEGRLEMPLSHRSIIGVGVVFGLIAVVFFGQAFKLQVVEGDELRAQSENNRLDKAYIIAERGVIYDRNGERLAWNKEDDDLADFAGRAYTDRRGLGQLLGYVTYPKKDSSGFYFRTEYEGIIGIEKEYNAVLAGENGEQLIEMDATQEVISQHVARLPTAGTSITLSIDAEFSEVLHDALAKTSEAQGFRSGAGVVMDVHTGEIIALANFPSYDPELLAKGSDADAIRALNEDPRLPFMNRIMSGLYTPGSIVKPFMAYAALAEGIVDPLKQILSTGQIVIPNPYNPDNPSIFRDWRAHGLVDMRRAIALSSNVYFYAIGGGYQDQKGLGISKIDRYMHMFGFGEAPGTPLASDKTGVVPNPEWKEEVFDDEWRLGDTYFTSIGQFGFQVTPLQMLRAFGAIANGGTMLTPHFVEGEPAPSYDLNLNQEYVMIIREGMRQAVLDGTTRALNRSDVHLAGKTGTAQIGANNEYINSWAVGFFPYEEPKYVFVTLLEQGPKNNLFGSAPTMSGVLDWLIKNRPEYLGLPPREAEAE
jgi:penicillin-binding protein 2